MTFSDKLGAQVAGQEGVLLPTGRPSDSREVAALDAAGAGVDNEFADDFANIGAVGDKIEAALDELAGALAGVQGKLADRVAKARAEAEQAKAAQAAAEEETKAAQAQAEADAAGAEEAPSEEPAGTEPDPAAEPESEEDTGAKGRHRAKT